VIHFAPVPKKNPPLFLTHPVFQKPAWGNNHPLAIPRQTAMLELCNILEWLEPKNTRTHAIANRKTLL
jgi:hypothetical protein